MENLEIKCKIEGVIYVSHPKIDACRGYAGESDYELCEKLPICDYSDTPLIFVKESEPCSK